MIDYATVTKGHTRYKVNTVQGHFDHWACSACDWTGPTIDSFSTHLYDLWRTAQREERKARR